MSDAFTAGVKMGGLNDRQQIRILLCYLIQSSAPLSRETLSGALLQEELVNWFELNSALADVEARGLVEFGPNGYTVTEKGAVVAAELSTSVPYTIREDALRAVLRIQRWKVKQASHHAVVEERADGWYVLCSIRDSAGELLNIGLSVPDAVTAEKVKNRFIARGSEIYSTLLDIFTAPDNEEDTPPEGASF